MNTQPDLPPGQYESSDFPRFGLPQFAFRFPSDVDAIRLEVTGEVERPLTVSAALLALPRVEQVSDFHCVTTWSRRAVAWSGFRFGDFYEQVLRPEARPRAGAGLVVLKGQDGYRTSLPLEDLLADEVLLADRLDGEPLSVEHGAPLRVVAPAHYAYKSLKHVCGVEFWPDDGTYRPVGLSFMAHPRGRVAMEERGVGAPGWLLRFLYRPLVRPAAARFRRAMAAYHRSADD